MKSNPLCVRCADAGWITALDRRRPSLEFTFRCNCAAGEEQPAGFPQWSTILESAYRRVTPDEMRRCGLAQIQRQMQDAKVTPLSWRRDRVLPVGDA